MLANDSIQCFFLIDWNIRSTEGIANGEIMNPGVAKQQIKPYQSSRHVLDMRRKGDQARRCGAAKICPSMSNSLSQLRYRIDDINVIVIAIGILKEFDSPGRVNEFGLELE